MLHYSDLQTFDPQLGQQLKLSLASEVSCLELRLKTPETLPLVVRNEGQTLVSQVEVAIFMPKGLLYAGGSPKGWMCSQRKQILHCVSFAALAPGESLRLEVPLAATYRVLQGEMDGIEARLVNHPGAEFEESLWVDVEMVWPSLAEQN